MPTDRPRECWTLSSESLHLWRQFCICAQANKLQASGRNFRWSKLIFLNKLTTRQNPDTVASSLYTQQAWPHVSNQSKVAFCFVVFISQYFFLVVMNCTLTNIYSVLSLHRSIDIIVQMGDFIEVFCFQTYMNNKWCQ